MAPPALQLAPRTKGRASAPLAHEFAGEVTAGDLALLASEREVPATPVVIRLRDRHHALARCLANGMTETEASIITGYDISRISILKRSPAFAGLVEDFKKIDAGLQAEFMVRATTLTMTAMDRLQEALEDDEKPMSPAMALEIGKFGADRTGHAPVQKSLNINASVDLGSRMAEARKRLAAVVAERESGEAVVGRST